MLACNVLLPGGINGDCTIPLSEVKNIIICDKGVKFSNSEKLVITNWKTKIQQSLTIYAVTGLDSYNNTTDAPNIVTGAVSKAKKITNRPIPSFEFFLESNFCDFKEVVKTLKGGVYGIFYELHGGMILGTQDVSGAEIGYFKPFKARIDAVSKLLQETDANTAFAVYVNHMVYSQVENQFLLEPAWDANELAESMPIGLNMYSTAVYAAGDQDVQITVRCGVNKTGLVVGDFETSSTLSNVSTPAVTVAADNGGGSYTLTVQKGAVPANLVAGDIVYVRVKVLSSSDVTHVSNWLRIEGA